MKLNLNRNQVSLGIRCRWGIRNALFYVAKDPSSDEKDKVLGVAMVCKSSHQFSFSECPTSRGIFKNLPSESITTCGHQKSTLTLMLPVDASSADGAERNMGGMVGRMETLVSASWNECLVR